MAIVLGYKGKSLVVVAVAAIAASLYFRAAGRSRPVEVERKTAKGGIQNRISDRIQRQK